MTPSSNTPIIRRRRSYRAARRHGRLAILLVAFLLPVSTTSTEAQTDFESWKQQQNASFNRYREQQDQAFSNFLQREWVSVPANPEKQPDPAPKPDRMPSFRPDAATLPPVSAADEAPPSRTRDFPKQTGEQPADILPTAPDQGPAGMSIDYFGANLIFQRLQSVPAPPRLSGKDAIRDFWDDWSAMPYTTISSDIDRHRRQMVLNDWGYLRLLHAVGAALYPANPNARALFVWFMMTHDGYNAKVGYEGNHIVLLAPTQQALYEQPYFIFDDQPDKFYAISLDNQTKSDAESIMTYQGEYPGADRRLDMSLTRMPRIRRDVVAKTFRFDHDGQSFTVPVSIDRSVTSFLTNYPQTVFKVYFSSPLSQDAENSLIPALKNLTTGRTQADAVNLLLHFVQTAFAYQTDETQFNREKPLFPDETLFYPGSDCEDRSILFAVLIRSVLGLDVLGLDYPAHVATAVRLNTAAPGYSVTYNGSTYTICDPTYRNADLGYPIPQVEKVNPTVIWASR